MTISPPTLHELLDLRGRTAIVTGGAMGIGRGVVERLSEAGASVVVADADLEAAEATCAELTEHGRSVMAMYADVGDPDDVHRLVADTVGWRGGVDILVNNAGIFPNVPVLEMGPDDFDRVLRVNLRGVGLAHYDASKHGVWGFTKNLALELAPHHIWVNAVAPGAIATPGVAATMHSDEPGGDDGSMLEAFLAQVPMGRIGAPDDIARVVLFLASDLASYVTGTQVVVDGGRLLS